MLKNFKIYFLCSFCVLSLSLGLVAIIFKKFWFDMVNEIFNSFSIQIYPYTVTVFIIIKLIWQVTFNMHVMMCRERELLNIQ